MGCNPVFFENLLLSLSTDMSVCWIQPVHQVIALTRFAAKYLANLKPTASLPLKIHGRWKVLSFRECIPCVTYNGRIPRIHTWVGHVSRTARRSAAWRLKKVLSLETQNCHIGEENSYGFLCICGISLYILNHLIFLINHMQFINFI